MKRLSAFAATAAAFGLTGVIAPASVDAAVVDDGVISPGEYSAVYTGGGSGFGGTLGGGQLHLGTDGTTLFLGFQPGNALNDNFVLHLDTRAGGFTDAQMNDTADPGRNLLSNLTRDVDDALPISPDFGIVIGGFGQVSFELNEGNTPGHLGFLSFEGDQTGNSASLAREFEIPLSTLGNPQTINFLASYGSDTNFMSNESIPADTFNSGGNPGFDNNGTGAPVVRTTFGTFNVPEPASMALAAIGAFLLGRRRRA
jgi:hypothetical protein